MKFANVKDAMGKVLFPHFIITAMVFVFNVTGVSMNLERKQ